MLTDETENIRLVDVMNDKYLTNLSVELGKEWTSLATGYLDFTLEQMYHISKDYPCFGDQVSTMLIYWRRRQPQREIKKAVTTLADGLIGCGRRDLAEYVQQLTEN